MFKIAKHEFETKVDAWLCVVSHISFTYSTVNCQRLIHQLFMMALALQRETLEKIADKYVLLKDIVDAGKLVRL